MTRTYVIPDVHGRFDLFEAAIQTILEKDPGTIICLGDYVDRGPQSKEVLNWLQQPAPTGWKIIKLKGNHEDMMYGALIDLDAGCRETWLGNGGIATLRQYHADRDMEKPMVEYPLIMEHLAMIRRMPLYYEDAHRVYVHARVNEGRPLEENQESTLMWARYEPADQGGYRGKHVVHGHTPRMYGPELRNGRTNLDIGAVFTGRMAVGIFDDDIPGGPVEILYVKDT